MDHHVTDPSLHIQALTVLSGLIKQKQICMYITSAQFPLHYNVFALFYFYPNLYIKVK